MSKPSPEVPISGRKKQMHRQAIIAILIAILLGSAACDNAAHSKAPEEKEEKTSPVNVKSIPVSLTSLAEFVVLSGSTEADKNVTFSAENPGRLEYLSVEFGQRVKKGQILARIDTAMLKARFNQAEANFQLANKTHERLQALMKDELVSQQQADEASAAMTSAEAALAIAKVSLDKSIVRSSTDGIVARRLVEVGEYVNPGQPIVQVVDFRTIVVTAQVPENQVGDIKRGSPVKVRFDSIGEEYDGAVYVVCPAAHPTSRTFELRIKVPNNDYRILVGMSATIRILIRTNEKVIVVPQDVVVEEADQRIVFVSKNGIAEKRIVELGSSQEDMVILKSGVNVGDQLIVVGQRDLVHGQKIHVIPN